MTERKEENKPTDKDAPAQPGAEGSAQPQNAQKPDMICTPAHASKGEKIYNWAVYSGINYWLNLAMSLVIADFFTHGKGRPSLVKTAKFFGRENEKSVHSAKVGLEQVVLNSGGWVILAPMKYLEDRKRHVVHWLNKKLGVQQVDASGNELGPEEIYLEKEQPHQSWGRVVGRRILAVSANVFPGMILDRGFAAKRERPVMVDGKEMATIGGKERFTKYVVEKSNMALNSGFIPGGKSLAEKDWVQRYLGLAALDVINTKITALVMRVTNGAKRAKQPHEVDKEPPDPPRVEADPAPSTNKADRAHLRSKKIAPKESHVEAIKSFDQSYGLRP